MIDFIVEYSFCSYNKSGRMDYSSLIGGRIKKYIVYF
jgi:hypothetical protein